MSKYYEFIGIYYVQVVDSYFAWGSYPAYAGGMVSFDDVRVYASDKSPSPSVSTCLTRLDLP
jgi:hypothetical protein